MVVGLLVGIFFVLVLQVTPPERGNLIVADTRARFTPWVLEADKFADI